MYREGWGVKRDYAKAIELFEQSGDDHALSNLGYMYQTGQGVKQDSEKAYFYYIQAAEKGDNNAQYNIAMVFLSGQGMERNLDLAEHYLKAATAQGNEEAAVILTELRKYTCQPSYLSMLRVRAQITPAQRVLLQAFRDL
ncbi:sel1 repeat family protein [Brevibacillus fluminis]|uniref:Sel1 repeat family protein n=1 Tax=Brevibacillus fluminis TaxID=511487 RepID=A0A3M8DWK8_9BACL|nr:tetratricopeptide repeat protein [Brevibacillus fluminis]RNB92498.1 sel1 repeat family protein [Brevibacillus fluminis]